MKPRILSRLVLFLLFALPLTATGQKTWLHYDIGYSFHQSQKIADEPGFFFSKGNNTIFGGYIEHELDSVFSIEAGLASLFYAYDGYYKGSDTSDILVAGDYLQISLRAKARWNVIGRVFLVPRLGASYIFLNKGAFNTIMIGQNNGFDLEIIRMFPRNFLLAEFGLGTEYYFGKRWKLAIDVAKHFQVGNKTPLAEYRITNKDIYQEIDRNFFALQLRIGYAFIRR
jgi:hypothetical protein